jgi:hypothetical protein
LAVERQLERALSKPGAGASLSEAQRQE